MAFQADAVQADAFQVAGTAAPIMPPGSVRAYAALRDTLSSTDSVGGSVETTSDEVPT